MSKLFTTLLMIFLMMSLCFWISRLEDQRSKKWLVITTAKDYPSLKLDCDLILFDREVTDEEIARLKALLVGLRNDREVGE